MERIEFMDGEPVAYAILDETSGEWIPLPMPKPSPSNTPKIILAIMAILLIAYLVVE